MNPTLDFARYALRPVPGGWLTRCKRCDRHRKEPTVDTVHAWQQAHTCASAAVAAYTVRLAQAYASRLTPDPAELILKRRADLIAEVSARYGKGKAA